MAGTLANINLFLSGRMRAFAPTPRTHTIITYFSCVRACVRARVRVRAYAFVTEFRGNNNWVASET